MFFVVDGVSEAEGRSAWIAMPTSSSLSHSTSMACIRCLPSCVFALDN